VPEQQLQEDATYAPDVRDIPAVLTYASPWWMQRRRWRRWKEYEGGGETVEVTGVPNARADAGVDTVVMVCRSGVFRIYLAHHDHLRGEEARGAAEVAQEVRGVDLHGGAAWRCVTWCGGRASGTWREKRYSML
jgi:hypothetical protein